jgi:hypothetical protein
MDRLKLETRATYLILTGLSIYALWWLALDLGVRMGFWPDDATSFDSAGFTNTQSLFNVLVFYVWELTKPLTWLFLLQRRHWAIYVHAAGFMASITDWILLNANAYYDSLLDAFSFIFEGALLYLLIQIGGRGFYKH